MQPHEPQTFVIILAIAALAVCMRVAATHSLPLVVLEIGLGILVGPQVLGWAEWAMIQVFSDSSAFSPTRAASAQRLALAVCAELCYPQSSAILPCPALGGLQARNETDSCLEHDGPRHRAW